MDTKSLVFVALAACAGPKPEVTRVVVSDAAPAGHVRVEIDATNRSRGHGQAVFDVTLVNRASGAQIVDEQTVELVGHQQIHITADIAAPHGEYDARVEAKYPD